MCGICCVVIIVMQDVLFVFSFGVVVFRWFVVYCCLFNLLLCACNNGLFILLWYLYS